MVYPEKSDRNAAWVFLYTKKRLSFGEIGRMFGRSRQRVHQVVQREMRRTKGRG